MGLLDNLGINKDTAGLLGMALMNRGNGKGNGMLKKMMMSEMVNNGGEAPAGINYLEQNYLPKSSEYIGSDMNLPNVSPATNLPSNKQELLSQLKANAELAYPNNPTMQQVAITQAIHESGLMGRPSQLASKYNNYFGIKAAGTGGTINMGTNEFMGGRNQMVNAGFGRNNSMGDSFVQHRNLMGNKRYAPVMSAQNPTQAFQALQHSGYATDPAYARNLNNVYGRYVAPMYAGQ